MIHIDREVLDSALIGELMPHIERNWDETGGFADLDLDIAWDAYLQLEEIGVLRVIVARASGVIAGYIFYVVSPFHPHDQKLSYAIQDTIFVEKEHRKSGIAVRMLDFAETYLQSEGVGVVTQSAKPGSSFNDVLVRKGYEHTDNMYLKRL